MNRTRKIGILKPDHLGDLVLSVPAINKIVEEFEDVTLLCNPYAETLAKTLWPALKLRPIAFPHLTKCSKVADLDSGPKALDFDWIISLRHDGILQKWIDQGNQRCHLMPRWTNDIHESRLQQETLYRIVGPYSRSAFFYRSKPPHYPSDPKRVGLCLSSGFSANRWPLHFWRELARLLKSDHREVILVGGPNERAEISVLAQWLDLKPSQQIIGGQDCQGFLDLIESKTDVIISADSGTAHICSLVRPLLSIFGPSPFRRYAPFGKQNRTLTFDLTCSPCSQFDKTIVNLCLSRECVQAIQPEQVLKALFHQPSQNLPGVDRTFFGNGLSLFYGVSHLPEPFWPRLPQTKTNQFQALGASH
jgi:ADP-heptose:LPS heptosyltransferase